MAPDFLFVFFPTGPESVVTCTAPVSPPQRAKQNIQALEQEPWGWAVQSWEDAILSLKTLILLRGAGSTRIWPNSRSRWSFLSLQGDCVAQWKVPGKLTGTFLVFSNTGVCFDTSVLTSLKPLIVISSKALLVE